MASYVSTLTQLQIAIANPPGDGQIYLTHDIPLAASAPLTIPIYTYLTIASSPPQALYSLSVPVNANYGTDPKNRFAIINFGNLTLTNIRLQGNNNNGGIGGIYNTQNLYLDGTTTFTNFPAQAQAALCNADADYDNDIYPGNIEMYNGSITDNSCRGVYNGNYAYFNMLNGNITYNSSSQNGGGIYNGIYATFNMYDGNIANNTSTQNGGGVYLDVDAYFDMQNGNIANNTSAQSGGGIYNKGNFYLQEGTLEANTAGLDGGGICTESDFLDYYAGISLYSGTLTGNTAGRDGGGIYAHNANIDLGDYETPHPSGSTFSCQLDTPCSCQNCQLLPNYALIFRKNKASRNGGAACLNGETYGLYLKYCLIQDNQAGANGGGLAINIADTETTSINSCAIVCNQATCSGGGLYFTFGGEFDPEDPDRTAYLDIWGESAIIGNTAGGCGGGIYTECPFHTYEACFYNNRVPLMAPVTLSEDDELYWSAQACCQSYGNTPLNNGDLFYSKATGTSKIPDPDPVYSGGALTWHLNFWGVPETNHLTFRDDLAPFTLIPGTASFTAFGYPSVTPTAPTQYPVQTTGTSDSPIFDVELPIFPALPFSLTFQTTAPVVSEDTNFANTATLDPHIFIEPEDGDETYG